MDSDRFQFSKRLVLINSASSVATRILGITVLLWAYQFLVKRIDPEEFAVYPVIASIMVGAPLFFVMFSGGVNRYIVDAHVRGSDEEVTEVASSVFPMLALAAAVFLSAGTLLAFNIERVLNIPETMVGDARLMLMLLLAAFAFRMLLIPYEAAFYVRQRFVELNLLTIVQEALRSLLLLVLLLALGPQVLWLAVAMAISDAVYVILMALRGARLLPTVRFRLASVNPRRARQLVSFGAWTSLGQLSAVILMNSGVIILNLFSTAVNVTGFHIGSMLYTHINRTMQMALRPLHPVMTAMNATGDDLRLAAVAMRGGRYACWTGLALAVPLAIYAEEFLTLFAGAELRPLFGVLVLFMVLLAFSRPTVLLATAAIAKAKVGAFYGASFAVMLLGVGGMVYAAAAGLGAVGVTAMLVGAILAGYAMFFWPLFLTLLGVRAAEMLREVVVPGMAPAAAGAAVWLILKELVAIESLSALLLCALPGGIAYAGALVAGCLTAADRADLSALLQRLRARSAPL